MNLIPEIGTVATAKDILARELSDQEIALYIRATSLNQFLHAISHIDAKLYGQWGNIEVQKEFLSWLPFALIPPDGMMYLKNFIAKGGILISPNQLLWLIRWVIENKSTVDPGPLDIDSGAKYNIMILLLAAGDRIGQKAIIESQVLGRERAYLQELIRNTMLNRRYLSLMGQLVRSYKIFTSEKISNFVKLADLDVSLLVSFGLLINGQLMDKRERMSIINKSMIGNLNQDAISIIERFVSPRELKDTLSEREDDFTWLRGNPAVSVNGNVFILSRSWLVDRFTTGLYYDINDRLNEKDQKQASNFRGRFGQALEEYARDILRGNGFDCKGDEEYYVNRKQYKASDCWFSSQFGEIIFEVKSKYLPAAAQVSGDIITYTENMQKGIIYSARQGIRFAQDLHKGLFDKDNRYHGPFWIFLVSTDDFAPAHDLSFYIDKFLFLLERDDCIKFPRRLHIDELPLIKPNTVELLIKWASNQIYYADSFSDWLLYSGYMAEIKALSDEWSSLVSQAEKRLAP